MHKLLINDVREPIFSWWCSITELFMKCIAYSSLKVLLTIEDQLVSISIATLTEEIVATAPFAPQDLELI